MVFSKVSKKVMRNAIKNKFSLIDPVHEILEIIPYFVCSVWFFTSQLTIFQLRWDGSSWFEPVLSKD